MTILTPNQIHHKLESEFPFFARHALKLVTKAGQLIPFHLNRAQTYLHERIEDQIRRLGYARIVVIKGRQEGVSTYVAGRFFHKTCWHKNKGVFILTHHSASTEALFSMVDRYHSNLPQPLKPPLLTNNSRAIRFQNGSSYKVGTAGTADVGRGNTFQFLHSSEAAFYDNEDGLKTGVFQAVSDEPGTEIIIESTGNGPSGLFYSTTMDALAGKSDFEVVFIPWFWMPEYSAKTPEDFTPDEDEATLAALYSLSNDQLFWRRKKIAFLGGLSKFRQEYPFTVHEAFQDFDGSFLDPILIRQAMSTTLTPPYQGSVVIGCDPGRENDHTAIAVRQGRHVHKLITLKERDSMTIVGKLASLIREYNAVKCFIDYGMGYGIVDRLHELGFTSQVEGINFGGKPTESAFLNKSAEMAFSLKTWLADAPVTLPNDEKLMVDLLAFRDFKQTSSGAIKLESKDEVRARAGFSPDRFDALRLTFAFPLPNEPPQSLLSRHAGGLYDDDPIEDFQKFNARDRLTRYNKKY